MSFVSKFIFKLIAGSTSVTASARTDLVCICRLFVKYLSAKKKSVIKKYNQRHRRILRALLTPLVGFFYLDLCIFVGPFTRTKSK